MTNKNKIANCENSEDRLVKETHLVNVLKAETVFVGERSR